MVELHQQLKQDCFSLGRFQLCQLLLMNDANFPWFILIPDREAVTEIFHLSEADQILLINESSKLAGILKKAFKADKINIAALGNLVPQLHLHHIVRYKTDICWPAPVWGCHPAKKYSDEELENVIRKIEPLVGNDMETFKNPVR